MPDETFIALTQRISRWISEACCCPAPGASRRVGVQTWEMLNDDAVLAAAHQSAPEKNWAGNVTYRARALRTPTSWDELAEIVATEPRLRVLGSRHSFNDLADTDGVLVSLAEFADEPIDVSGQTARVPAALRYGDLVPTLAEHGFALANLASLPHIAVAGSVTTGTHGSGDRIGSLATQVAALEMVTPAGRVRLDRGEPDFDGAVVSLGALGVVTHVHLDVEPLYEVAQTVFEGVTWDAALADLDALTGAGDSVSLFCSWQDPARVDQVWVKSRSSRPAPDLSAFGGRPADGPRHPVADMDPEPCTTQGGVPGPWYERMPHFSLDHTPSVGEEIQSEYLLPRADAAAAVEALQGLAERFSSLLFVGELRTVAEDALWLSPAYGTPTVGVHFTWRAVPDAVRTLLPTIEAALPETARPHWAKVATMAPDAIRARYERWDDFAALRTRFDPERRFVNPHLARFGL